MKVGLEKNGKIGFTVSSYRCFAHLVPNASHTPVPTEEHEANVEWENLSLHHLRHPGCNRNPRCCVHPKKIIVNLLRVPPSRTRCAPTSTSHCASSLFTPSYLQCPSLVQRCPHAVNDQQYLATSCNVLALFHKHIFSAVAPIADRTASLNF